MSQDWACRLLRSLESQMFTLNNIHGVPILIKYHVSKCSRHPILIRKLLWRLRPVPLLGESILRNLTLGYYYFGQKRVLQKHYFMICINENVITKWWYGQWDHLMASTSKLIYLEKRYQQNPKGGFPTFPDTL